MLDQIIIERFQGSIELCQTSTGIVPWLIIHSEIAYLSQQRFHCIMLELHHSYRIGDTAKAGRGRMLRVAFKCGNVWKENTFFFYQARHEIVFQCLEALLQSLRQCLAPNLVKNFLYPIELASRKDMMRLLDIND